MALLVAVLMIIILGVLVAFAAGYVMVACEQMDTQYCPVCGRRSTSGNQYCPYDGAELKPLQK